MTPLSILVFSFCLAAIVAICAVFSRLRTRERFVFDVPAWSDPASGPVGRDEVLNDNGQQVVRNQIDKRDHSGRRCTHKGVDLPPSWLHTDEEGTCALDTYHHVVRNDCSNENDTLFTEGTIVKDAFIDPNTFRCNVSWDPDASPAQVEAFRREVDVEYLNGLLQELRDQARALEKQREKLANRKHDLETQVRENEDKLDELQARITSLEDEIDGIRTKIGGLEDDIRGLEEQVSDLRRKANTALIGNKISLSSQGGDKWRVDVDGRIRLKSGREVCMTVMGDDSRIYKSHEGMLAFFDGDDAQNAVRHRGFTMWTEPLNRGPAYDFAYRIRYESDGISLENDYGGTSYVGYDSSRDEVRIYTDASQKVTWKLENGCTFAPIYMGPPHPTAISGGFCCWQNGMRLVAKQPFRMGRASVFASRAGRITVRLTQEVGACSVNNVITKTLTVQKGQQNIDLDIDVPFQGRFLLYHDRRASPTSSVQLYRSSSRSEVPRYFRDYDGVVEVLTMGRLDDPDSRRGWAGVFWYSFYNIEVFPSARTLPDKHQTSGSNVCHARVNDRHVHIFTGNGTFQAKHSGTVDVLIVGGGGGGGSYGGGGAGGVVLRQVSVTPGNYAVRVGGGGGGNGGNRRRGAGDDGGTSSFRNERANGGGGGAGHPNNSDPKNARSSRGATGGSGGGAGSSWGMSSYSGGSGGSLGNSGGDMGGRLMGGGGGGAGSSGEASRDSSAGAGGDGVYHGNIFGTDVGVNGWFGGGGGGGAYMRRGPARGKHGGGDGRYRSNAPSGRAGTGGGGGGAGWSNRRGGSGGSGLVIIRQ